MIRYNNVIERLKEAGYTPSRIKEEKLLSEATMRALRHNGNITTDSLNKICGLLQCQPSDVLTWFDEGDGYFIADSNYLEFAQEDIEDAKRNLLLISKSVSNVVLMIKSGKKNLKELENLSDAIDNRTIKTIDKIKSAEKNLKEVEKVLPKIYIPEI